MCRDVLSCMRPGNDWQSYTKSMQAEGCSNIARDVHISIGALAQTERMVKELLQDDVRGLWPRALITATARREVELMPVMHPSHAAAAEQLLEIFKQVYRECRCEHVAHTQPVEATSCCIGM